MKTYNIYHIKDPKVVNARKCLAQAIKYLCQIENRPKGKYVTHRDPFGPYNSYIMAYNELSREYSQHALDKAPDEFFTALVADEVNLDEVVREFLQAVARYLFEKKGFDLKVVFLPFYFQQSYERAYFPENAHLHYFDYVRNYPMGEYKYTLEELKEMLIEEECLKDEIDAFEEVHVSDFYEDDNNGYTYGLHIGTFTRNKESIDIEAQWFKTEDERESYKKELVKEGYKDLDDVA